MIKLVKYVSFVFISLTFMLFLCCCHVIGQNDNNTSSSMSSATRSIIETNKIKTLPDYSLQENQKEQLNKHLISEEDVLNDMSIRKNIPANGNFRFYTEGIYFKDAIYIFYDIYSKDKFADLSDKKLLSTDSYRLFSLKNSKDNDVILGDYDMFFPIYKKCLSTNFLLNGTEYIIGYSIHISIPSLDLSHSNENIYVCDTLYMESWRLIEKIDKIIGETEYGALIYSVVDHKETEMILISRSPCAWLVVAKNKELIDNLIYY